MTDTAPNQDSELKTFLRRVYFTLATEDTGMDENYFIDYSGFTAELIALKQRWSTEARIDELQGHVFGCDGKRSQARLTELAELKATLQPGEKG